MMNILWKIKLGVLPLFFSILLLLVATPAHAATVTANYTYDNIGRLISTSYTNAPGVGAISYNYDPAGNLLASTTTGAGGTNQPPVPTATGITTTVGAAATSQIAAHDPNATDTHTYAVSTVAINGIATVNAFGLATYTPNTGYVGTDSFVVTVTDNGIPAKSGAVTVHVAVNTQASPVVAAELTQNITQTSALLRFMVAPNGVQTNLSIALGTTINYGKVINYTATPLNSNATLFVQQQATNLVCGTVYHYQARVSNSSGANFDIDRQFTTLSCPATNLSPVITGVIPTTATVGVAQNYTITGSNLLASMVGHIQGSSQCSYVSGAGNKMVMNCIAGVAGNQHFYLRTIVSGVTQPPISGSASVLINVTAATPVDKIPPVITLVGGNITIAQGSTYRDAGATALDNVDGNITNKIVVSNLVNSSAIGTYTVSYNVKDAAGNSATPVTRTVNVVAPGGATAVSMAKMNAAPGGTVNVPVTIAPPAGVAVAAFNLVVNYDGNKLTLGTVSFNGAPASWKCSSSMLPPAPSGIKGVQMVCSTAVAADAIKASSTVAQLPMTVNAATPLGTVLAISLSPNSKLFDGAGIAIASSLNNGSITVNNSTAVSYTLTPGWNLVAFPLDFGAKGLSDFLAKASAVSAVWTYKNGQWQSYIVGVPSFMNSLTAIKPGDGYWVKSTSKTLVAMTGTAAPALVTPTYKLGWHLVGALAPVSNVATYLTSQGATEIWGYSNGNWCSNISGIPAFMNCLKTMQPEVGYFIKTP